MNTILHFNGQTDVPIVCDMSTAPDTPDERMAEWRELFNHVLVRRERHADSVALYFRAEPGRREQLEDLASREHACCPCLDIRLGADGGELIWTTTNVRTGEEHASIDVFLDALYALPDHAAGDMEGLLDQFAEHGLNVVTSPEDSKRFELG
jgi:hypothetical protein